MDPDPDPQHCLTAQDAIFYNNKTGFMSRVPCKLASIASLEYSFSHYIKIGFNLLINHISDLGVNSTPEFQ